MYVNFLFVLFLAMNVSGDRIIRDLWVLKYHHKTIQERLERVKNVGVENLYPWMVRCSEDILNRLEQFNINQPNIIKKCTDKCIETNINNRTYI